jgi:hypothetical protein
MMFSSSKKTVKKYSYQSINKGEFLDGRKIKILIKLKWNIVHNATSYS